MVSDTTDPMLSSFSIDLDAGTFVLTFNEVVRANSFKFDQFTILRTSGTTLNSLTLTGGTALPFNSSSTVTVEFSRADLDVIKLDDNLCSVTGNCLLTITSTAVSDTEGNSVNPITPASPLEPSSLTQDVSPPMILSFDFIRVGTSMLNQLILRFDEPVEFMSADVSLITFYEDMDGNNTNTSYSLTSSSSVTNTDDSAVITIALSSTDYEALINNPPILQSVNTTYLQISAGAFSDRESTPIEMSDVVQVDMLVGDFVPPRLSSFVLDLDDGVIFLTFNEAVNLSTVVTQRATLQQDEDRDSVFLTIPAGSSVEQGDTTSIVKVLLNQTTQYMLVTDGIGSSVDNTYIALEQGFVMDLVRIDSLVIPENNGLRASSIVPDTGAPQLTGFSFQFDPDVITLTFTKTINVSSVDVTYFTVQNRPGKDSQSYTLTNATIPPGDTTVVQLSLSEEDSNAIKALEDLAVNANNTYISFSSFFANGANDVPVAAVPPTNPRIVDSFGADTTPPQLLSFDLDLTTAQLTLRFDETINVTSFLQGEIVFQDGLTPINNSFTLSGGMYDPDDTSSLVVSLANGNIDSIRTTGVCTQVATCFISFLLKYYCHGHGWTGCNAQCNQGPGMLSLDSANPMLVEFVEFNLITGRITLLFDEPLDNTTINATGLRLQSLFASG